ncbi:MAG TPA: exodeoxyribonuclease VII large subunit [Phycisphaeraceae bacterium]|nr:exodeoxyribonuclease VII large subunit [Phycisphaeraceae bacterium]
MSQLHFNQFDPQKMSGPAKVDNGRKRKKTPDHLTVGQVSRLIDETLKDHLPSTVRVIGEISGFRDRTHWYFDLKDSEAVLNCVAFASVARTTGFVPENGMEVVVTGRIEHYAKQGKTQLYARRIEPVGQGSLEIAFRKLCEELREAGYFDPRRKKRLPTFPGLVAVVTSRSGAALQDVLDTMRRRCPAVAVGLVDVRVQGDQAAKEIARAIRNISRLHEKLGIDAVILTRGGGSMEDLWAFNERIVADVLFRCPVPVIAAIGHETDTTVAELVADERAATPTQAAMRLTPDRSALSEQLFQIRTRLVRSMSGYVKHERQRLLAVSRHSFFTDAQSRLEIASRRLTNDAKHLRSALQSQAQQKSMKLAAVEQQLISLHPDQRLTIAKDRLSRVRADLTRALRVRHKTAAQQCTSLEKQLNLAGPGNILQRGYSITFNEQGRVIRSISRIKPGSSITTRFADGEADSQVISLRETLLVQHEKKAVHEEKSLPPQEESADPQMDLFTGLE